MATLGKTTIGGTQATSSSFFHFGAEYTAASTGTAIDMQFYASGGGTNSQAFVPVIYSVVAGVPTSLLATGTTTTVGATDTARWYVGAISLAITSGTTYLIGLISCSTSAAANLYYDAVAGANHFNLNSGGATPDSSWGTDTTEAKEFSFFLDVAVGSGVTGVTGAVTFAAPVGSITTGTGVIATNPAAVTYAAPTGSIGTGTLTSRAAWVQRQNAVTAAEGTPVTMNVTAPSTIGHWAVIEFVAPAVVPGAPTTVTATAGNASANVSWTAPLSDGGSAITLYLVTAFVAGVFQSSSTVGNLTSTTIGSLVNGTAYTFTVAAINSIGTGPASTSSAPVTPTGTIILPGGGSGSSSPVRVGSPNLWYPTLTQSHNDAMQFVVTAPISGTLLYSSPVVINSGSTSPTYLPGTIPAAGQPRPAITDGTVTFSKTATVRSTMTMKLVDDTGLLIPPDHGGILTPWGNEISIYRGVVYPDGTTEMPLLGIFRMTDVNTDDNQGSPIITISGSDRSRIISRNKVINYYQSGLSEAYTDIIRDMARLTYPSVTFNASAAEWRNVPPPGIGAGGGIVATDALVPLIYQEGTDLWTEMKNLANSLACDLYFNRNGVLTLVLDPNMNYTLASLPTIPTPVATFIEGSQARFIRAQRTLSDKDAYNQWVVTGEGQVIGASLNPIRSVPAQDTDPSSPTYINGPYGVVNGFETNTLMRTQAQVNLFAQYKLRISAGAQEQVAFDGFADSYLDIDNAISIVRTRLGIPNNSYIIDTIVHTLNVNNPMQVTLRERRSLA